MSTDTKYLVMSELIGIPAAAIEKAEEQASRIIQIVQGGWTKEEIDKCSLRGISTVDLVDNAAFIQRAPVATAEPITGADIAFLKGKGHTWQEIAVTTGLTQDKARHLYRKWQKTQKADVLYEPGAEEAAAEATLAEEVLKSANQNERGPSKDEQIDQLIRSYANEAFDIEILQAVKRNFPCVSMTVADIRERRQKA